MWSEQLSRNNQLQQWITKFSSDQETYHKHVFQFKTCKYRFILSSLSNKVSLISLSLGREISVVIFHPMNSSHHKSSATSIFSFVIVEQKHLSFFFICLPSCLLCVPFFSLVLLKPSWTFLFCFFLTFRKLFQRCPINCHRNSFLRAHVSLISITN